MYDGIKKDDYVVVSAAGNYGTGNGLVEKADVVTGKVTGTNLTTAFPLAATGTPWLVTALPS